MAMSDQQMPSVRGRAAVWRATGAALTAVLLALAAMVPLPEQTAQGKPPQIPVELSDALSEVETSEADAEAVAGEPGLVAGATPCTMRHGRVAPGVDRALRHRLAVATLATGPDLKEALLTDLETITPSGPAKWRLAIARTELALRDGRYSDAIIHLDRAAATKMPDWCKADELFLRAAATSGDAEAVSLLDAAVTADPGFWAAQERLAVLAAKGTGSDVETCGLDAARTIRATVQLGALATRDSQFERLERTLVGLAPNGRTALLRGMILRQTGRIEAARDRWSKALTELGTSDCDAVLRIAIERMLENTKEERP